MICTERKSVVQDMLFILHFVLLDSLSLSLICVILTPTVPVALQEALCNELLPARLHLLMALKC